MNYADLLLSITGDQKRAILKLGSTSDLMAYAEAEGLNFAEQQAEKLMLKIRNRRNELTAEEKSNLADNSRITSEPPCRYCGSRNMELSVDSYCIYVQCSACKCNIIEI